MNFKKFMARINRLEILANEFMTNVAIQVTNDSDGDHTATFMLTTPYSDKLRDVRVVVSPFAPDELVIELDKEGELFFNADRDGLYTVLWHAAESDLARVTNAISTSDPYENMR